MGQDSSHWELPAGSSPPSGARRTAILRPESWRPRREVVVDLAAVGVVAVMVIAAWIVTDPITTIGGLPDGSVSTPQWFSCCEVSNELSWSAVLTVLASGAVASAIAGRWARPLAAGAGVLIAAAVIALGEANATTASALPWSWAGRGYGAAIALVASMLATATAAISGAGRHRLAPR